MALSVKLSTVSIDKTARVITLKDSTGTYDSVTNPTGYGLANTYIAPASWGALLWRYWGEDIYTQRFLSGASLSAILGAGLAVTPDNQGLTAVAGEPFADGVHQLKYVPLFELVSTSGTFVAGSKTVAVTGVNPQSLDKTVIKYLYGTGSGFATPVYEIDWDATLGTSSFVLKTVAVASGSAQALAVGAEADVKIHVNKQAERCLVSQIGKLSEATCDCGDEEAAVSKLIRWRFAADVKFQKKDYNEAHNLTIAVAKQCEGCDCGC